MWQNVIYMENAQFVVLYMYNIYSVQCYFSNNNMNISKFSLDKTIKPINLGTPKPRLMVTH